jgi:hypothetical protein
MLEDMHNEVLLRPYNKLWSLTVELLLGLATTFNM